MATSSLVYRIATLQAKIELAVSKVNTCHVGGGSKGGQFCATGGGGGGGAASTAGSSGGTVTPSEHSLGVTHTTQPPSLSTSELEALNSYKGMGFVAINNHLLGRPGGASVQQQVDNLSAVVDRSSITKDTVLYRGISGKYAKGIASLPVGAEYTIPSFQSTSSQEGTATIFAAGGYKNGRTVNQSPVLLEVKVPRGTKGLEIEQFTKDGLKTGEGEVVLGPNLKYRIVKSRKTELRVGYGFNSPLIKATVVQVEVIT